MEPLRLTSCQSTLQTIHPLIIRPVLSTFLSCSYVFPQTSSPVFPPTGSPVFPATGSSAFSWTGSDCLPSLLLCRIYLPSVDLFPNCFHLLPHWEDVPLAPGSTRMTSKRPLPMRLIPLAFTLSVYMLSLLLLWCVATYERFPSVQLISQIDAR